MQKISNISFKGIEQKPLDTAPSVSVPIETHELGEKALPIGDKSLAIDPVLPNEFLGEADLKRYKKVQLAWAESFSKRTGISVENILARLPEVQFGDAKSMLQSQAIGQFDDNQNVIEITPIKEWANVFGGDESKIVHETTHGYFHNLRRAFAHSLNDEQQYVEAASAVVNKVLHGENDPVIHVFDNVNVNGQDILMPQFIKPPRLSKPEREAFVDTLNLLRNEHFNPDTGKLNEYGIKHIKETLIPRLTTYSHHFADEPAKQEEAMLDKMVSYTDSFYTRRNFLLNIIKWQNTPDLDGNFEKALTDKEKVYAKNTLNGLLSTQEGNYLRSLDPNGFMDSFSKAYFMSFEERRAREEESIFRHQNINKEIAKREKQGLRPLASQLKEQQVVKNNLKFLYLTQKLETIEKELASAKKSPEKIAELNNSLTELRELMTSNSSKLEKINGYINPEELAKIDLSNEEEFLKFIDRSVPVGLKDEAVEYINISRKIGTLVQQQNQLGKVENLLAETPENTALKSQFDAIMTKMKGLAKDCDLMGIPRQFYGSDKDLLEAVSEMSKLYLKWVRRIL